MNVLKSLITTQYSFSPLSNNINQDNYLHNIFLYIDLIFYFFMVTKNANANKIIFLQICECL